MSDCERPDYYRCTEPVARKAHECCECSAKIVPGEKHLRVDACWDRQPDRFRQHLRCAEACELVRDKDLFDGDCLGFGELRDFWVDSDGEWANLGQLEARRKLWSLMLGIIRRERKKEAA